MPIESLSGAVQAFLPGSDSSSPPGSASGFGSTLERLVSGVEKTNTKANQAIAEMIDGTGDVHDAMIALQRADLTLQLTVQIRNKLVQAYQEIMRMPV